MGLIQEQQVLLESEPLEDSLKVVTAVLVETLAAYLSGYLPHYTGRDA